MLMLPSKETECLRWQNLAPGRASGELRVAATVSKYGVGCAAFYARRNVARTRTYCSEWVSESSVSQRDCAGTTGNLRNPKVLNLIHTPTVSPPYHNMSRFFRQAADSDSESSDSEESLLSSDEDAAPTKSTAPAKPAMSRFLRTANASDSSSSSSGSESEDEDESDDEGGAHKEAKSKSRFLRDSDEEESDEEVKRVVKSARDKRL